MPLKDSSKANQVSLGFLLPFTPISSQLLLSVVPGAHHPALLLLSSSADRKLCGQ